MFIYMVYFMNWMFSVQVTYVEMWTGLLDQSAIGHDPYVCHFLWP